MTDTEELSTLDLIDIYEELQEIDQRDDTSVFDKLRYLEAVNEAKIHKLQVLLSLIERVRIKGEAYIKELTDD